ncbi:MAG: bacteriohemerythrin [Nitrospinota bacterium]|nr:bacteriohemerythrin [Nitrospinota bacterium]
MLAEWNDSFSVGIAKIDDQHKILFQLINRLSDGIHEQRSRAVLGEAIEDTIQYTLEHFATEEDLMREHGFPDIQKHQDEHNAMTAKLAGYKERYERGEADFSMDLLMELIDWLHSHMGDTDALLKPFMNSRGVY